jgi:hypothetical protein
LGLGCAAAAPHSARRGDTGDAGRWALGPRQQAARELGLRDDGLMTTTPPDVLYLVSHGFAARMVLHSDLLARLSDRGVTVAVLAPSAADEHFRALCARRGADAIVAPAVSGRLLGQYAQSRRYLFEDYEGNAALYSKHLWDVENPDAHWVFKARSHVGKGVNAAFSRVPALRGVASRLEQRALRSREVRRVLSEVRPRLVVSTYPVATLEALALLEARRLGIATVGQLLSWDNITCKGRFIGVPDRFISWGPIMTEELRSHYGTSGERVLEAGVAHFDLHARRVEPERLAQHLRGLGLDPTRPYLFFGMSASFFTPREVEVVAWLAARVREGALGSEMQLLVRPHPQNIRGPMSDPHIVARLRSVAGGPVAVDLPEVVSDAMDMAEHDMLRLAALLHGAAVTLNSGSTLTIDAMLHDRPVVLTLFDAEDELPWWRSARRLGEFPHLAKLLSYGGVAEAHSFAELERHLRAYLSDPSLHREARSRALRAECGVTDGRACERIADGIAAMVADARARG